VSWLSSPGDARAWGQGPSWAWVCGFMTVHASEHSGNTGPGAPRTGRLTRDNIGYRAWLSFFALPPAAPPATFRIVMPESPLTPPPEVLPAGSIGAPAVARPTPEGEAALAMAAGLARRAAASATLRAYKADWQHYAAWCARPSGAAWLKVAKK
jgi:hypothetical protein